MSADDATAESADDPGPDDAVASALDWLEDDSDGSSSDGGPFGGSPSL